MRERTAQNAASTQRGIARIARMLAMPVRRSARSWRASRLNDAVQRTVCFKNKTGVNNMKALVYKGPRDVQVKNVPDAKIERPTDVLVKITRTNICGSDLHMYEGRTDMEKGRV